VFYDVVYEPMTHQPITETQYCYCPECCKKVGNYLLKWADNKYKEKKEDNE
jgi:hypothetical protein